MQVVLLIICWAKVAFISAFKRYDVIAVIFVNAKAVNCSV